jgi:hypothetical protein
MHAWHAGICPDVLFSPLLASSRLLSPRFGSICVIVTLFDGKKSLAVDLFLGALAAVFARNHFPSVLYSSSSRACSYYITPSLYASTHY